MHFRDVTARLNQIPVQQAGQWLGISNLPRSGSLRCPFPDHRDKNPSFEIRRCGLRWKCYACDRAGGTIDFVAICRQTDFRAARQWLLERTENRHATVYRRTIVPLPAPVVAAPIDIAHDIELYEAFLRKCPLAETGHAYLQSRHFEDATIAHFRIGQMPAANLAPSLATEFGFERLMAAGLLSKRSTSRDIRLTFRPGYLIFPILEDGKVISLQARQVGPAVNGPKYIYLTGKQPRTYNLDVLGSNTRDIAICEGIPDTMAAHQLGLNAIGLLGVSNTLRKDEIARLKGKRVQLLLDWDEKGEVKAQKLRSELASYGIVCDRKSKPTPQVKDLNDYMIFRRNNVSY